MGGRTQQNIPIYNSSGGPSYGGVRTDGLDSWPGYGQIGNEGPLNDYWPVISKPVEYAQELLDEGIGGPKVWTLDFATHKSRGPIHIRQADVDEALRPLREIRDKLGDC